MLARSRIAVPALLPALALALTLAGCSGDAGSAEPSPTPSSSAPTQPEPEPEPSAGGGSGDQYVALGDSYTAAPLVPETDLESGCFQSNGNYPHLVAAAIDADLVDVSCGGATTDHMRDPQPTGDDTQPPQLDALSEDTDLVTLGIGGNDFGLFTSALFQCAQLSASDPEGSPCLDASARESLRPAATLRRIQDNVEGVVADIAERSPQARILVVTYPRLVPTSGSCPDRLPLSTGDYGYVASVNQGLSDALRGAARAGGAEYVDLYRASRGHDICSDEPWVNGLETAPGQAAPFHPFPAGQQAVADLVLELL